MRGITDHLPAFTIVGASGFVGSNLLRYLRDRKHVCHAPGKGAAALFDRHLGHVIYCAGLTSDSRSRPHDTVEAHVSLLNRLVQSGKFDSLVYLSSTRVYIHSDSTEETARLGVMPQEPEDLFNLSKLMGEAICLHAGRGNVKIVRLSNVLGPDFGSNNFVFALIRAAIESGKIELQTTLESEKDYVHIDDVIELLPRIALEGKEQIYNLAFGQNRSNAEILSWICQAVAATVTVKGQARTIRFKPINIARIRDEFDFSPRLVLPLVAELARACQTKMSADGVIPVVPVEPE